VRFLLLRGACAGFVSDGNVSQAPARTGLWGTQWGQLDQSPAVSAPCVQTTRVIRAAFAASCLVHSASSGVGLGASAPGLGLLPG